MLFVFWMLEDSLYARNSESGYKDLRPVIGLRSYVVVFLCQKTLADPDSIKQTFFILNVKFLRKKFLSNGNYIINGLLIIIIFWVY